MSLAAFINTGDVAQLPGRRDEDWRWSDLRGLIRIAPPPSPVAEARGAGPFDGLGTDRVVVVNGRGAEDIRVGAGERRTVVLRFVSRADGTAHHAAVTIDVAAGGSLVLFESYEGQGEGYLADAALDIRLAQGAALERIVLAADTAEAISVSQANVALSEHATFAQTFLTHGAKRQRSTASGLCGGHVFRQRRSRLSRGFQDLPCDFRA